MFEKLYIGYFSYKLENIYFTVILLIILMLSDYLLTLKGYRLYKQKYSKFVEIESYELNPMFKESISKKRYNFKHLFGIIFSSFLLFFVYYLGINHLLGVDITTFHLLQGMLFSNFLYVNSRHIQNIMLFRSIIKNEKLLTGKLKQHHLFSLESSKAQLISIFLVFFSIYIFFPNPFTLGFALGPIIMLFWNYIWTKRYLKKEK